MSSGLSREIYAETLAVFDQSEHRYEPLTTPEVADALDVSRRAVYKRLQKLVDHEELETKETGSNSRVWWRPPAESSTATSSSRDTEDTASSGCTASDETVQNDEETSKEREQSGGNPRTSVDYGEVFETIPDGVALHDPTDGTLVDVNEQYCEMLGYTREELLASGFEGVHAEVPPYTSDRAKQYIQQAKAGRSRTVEWLDETKEGDHLPVEVHFRRTTSMDEDRVLTVVRDISDREEREQDLRETNRQLQAVLDTVEASLFIKDTAGRYQLLNDEAREMVGLDPDEDVVGLTDDDLFPGDIAERYRVDDQRVVEQDETIRIEEEIPTPQGTRTNLTLKSPLFDADGDPVGVCAVSTDITDRKERERELQVHSAAMETSTDGMAILDSNDEYVFVNRAHAEIYGYDDPDAFVDETWRMCYDEDELTRFEDEIMPTLSREGAWRGEAIGQRKDGTTFPQELSLTVTDNGGIVCVVRDITDRRERERALSAARQFNEELVENAPFGMFRLDEDLRIVYENPRAERIIGLPADEVSSTAIGEDIRELPSIVETGDADQFTRLKDGETIEFEFPFESIYGREAYFTGRGVPLYRDGEFDGAVLMATDISERRQYERELERQRERLAALDELNDVVREITDTAIDQSTRGKIEQVVCDRLAESDSYQFAWICAVDSKRQLEPRVEAGVDGYLDDIPLSSHPDDPADQGPAGRAVRTREIQITQNVFDAPDLEAYQEYAREYGYRSSAVIPITHNGTLYGLIGVYTDRTGAFAEDEQKVIGQIGEVVGHAIAAIDRKRGLTSDEVIQLKIRVPELLESRDIPVTTDGTITIERTVPRGDGEHLLYGTASPDAMEVIHALGDRLPGWEAVRRIDETDGKVRFEQRLSNPPIASLVADHGGQFETGRIEDGEYGATIHLPPGTDIRGVVADIRETYPDVETVSQQQVAREKSSPQQLLSDLTEILTERQRAALEAGYYGGFFQWPRDSSGEDVAGSLDIGASTFHQHVRKAEKKLLDLVFTEF